MATRPQSRGRFDPPLLLTLGFVLLIVALLVLGGLFVRQIVVGAFSDAERIRIARVHVSDMVREQLDEETGVRGYSNVRNPIMLEAYYGGRASMPLYFRRVYADLEALNVGTALPALRDAEIANFRWIHEVAFPLISSRAHHAALQLRGKTLVDRFRIDANAIDVALARRTVLVNTRTQKAIVWIGILVGAAAAAVVFAAVIFAVQQYRLNAQLERERAAYEAEKRVADILQQAFAERLFPVMPSVTFSATYVPASEQTKIGGDWYDALALSEERVLLAIGDVTGHGIDAVIAMNKARQLLIGSALLDATPDHVLQRVNAELARGRSPIITAISSVIDTRTREFSYAAAGHPPPVVLEPGRPARLLEFGSLPLGVKPNAGYQTRRIMAAPGALIVLYTDGLIEYSRNLAAGESALLEAVESASRRPPGELAAAIRERIFGDRKVSDDVAILTVKFAATFSPAPA